MTRLDRNTNPDQTGKYALVRMDKYLQQNDTAVYQALVTLEKAGILEHGPVGGKDEFFVIKLKDPNAKPALEAYAKSCEDPEFANEVLELASRCK